MGDKPLVTMRIPGREEPAVPDEPAQLGVAVTVKAAARVGAVRGAGEEVTLEAQRDDVVELRMDGGAVLWVRADEVEALLAAPATRGDAAPGTLVLPAAIPDEGRRRGLGAWSIDVLRVLGVDLGEATARTIAERLDRQTVEKPGLFHWDGGNECKTAFAERSAGPKPWLVFLHGTASSTVGSFGDLPNLQGGVWQQLRATYAERILAFQHWTLTESPIANALALVRALPEDVELHLVSHSRGGLIGELLGRARLTDAAGVARAAFDEADLGLFERAPEAERELLVELNEVLARKRPRVTGFARVACPARGTGLMDDRLDRWLNLVFNVASIALGGRLNPATAEILDGLRALTLAVVKERTDPRTLPGLAAMSPAKSPLLQVLNRLDIRQDDGLHVIAGDAEPNDLLRRVAIWFADRFFGHDHDLVVETSSMEGGAQRKMPPQIFRDRGASVTHFNYFANGSSVETLVAALSAAPAGRGVGEELARAASERMPKLVTRGADAAPVVFVLPGISGSHLRIGDKPGENRVWIDLLALAAGGVARLDIGNSQIQPDEPVARYYGELCRYLSDSHDVRPWPYDWRRSILETAPLLARDLHAALDATTRPVRIVAHSMGGLVARAALALDENLRKRWTDRAGRRLVMLGTPNGGSFSIPLMMIGRNRLMQYLALLDIKASAADHLKVVTAWPGALQLLPVPDDDPAGNDGFDLWTDDAWAELSNVDGGWPMPLGSALAEARRLRDLLRQSKADPATTVYVAGQDDTYERLKVDRSKPQGQRIRFAITTEGDDQVLWRTGIPKDIPAWYTDAVHGDLARHRPTFPAILDLLELGTTDRLAKSPPAISRARGAPADAASEPAMLVPSEDQVLAAATGAAPWVPEPPLRQLRVRVVHGHLKHAGYPVMVGHYVGDSLNGSELMLDREQGGRISRRRARGLDPGDLLTFDVHLDDKEQPPGSVVVGLGEAADLTAGKLRRTIRHGLFALASAMDERAEQARRDGQGGNAAKPRGVSLLLIGSGAGVVTVPDSVRAILGAVLQVNRALGDSGFVELELVDWVEQRAISAWHALHLREDRGEFGTRFALDPEVLRRAGGWHRVGPDDDRSWWTPITIRNQTSSRDPQQESAEPKTSEPPALSFIVLSGRARAEASLVAKQHVLVSRYLERIAQRRVEEGASSAGRTLFELLWPNRLKEQSLEDRNIRLILDETAAALPWEMLDDRRPWVAEEDGTAATESEPPAARYGIIRQLVSLRPRDAIGTSRGRRRALVIGDPRGEPSPLDELAGAQREAQLVKEALEARDYQVVDLIGPRARPDQVVSALFSDAWQIVHIAAHGVFEHRFTDDPAEVRKTGIVLGGKDDVLVLDSSILNQMPVRPELFFVNCCLLGSMDPLAENEFLRAARPALARSIAVQLIRMGVRAVVAAGWEVADDAAELFARSLYRGLLSGERFGRATHEARREVYRTFPTSSTWGAYQCYGTPDFTLPGPAAAPRHIDQQFASPNELVSELERVRALGEVGGQRDAVKDLEALRRLEDRAAAKGWLRRAEIRAALARTYADLRSSEKAIEHYTAAALTEVAAVPVQAIEERLNMIARYPEALNKVHPEALNKENPIDVIKASVRSLEALIAACGETQERLSLIGGSFKRLAQRVEGPDRTAALRKMRDQYRKARKLGQARGTANVFYPWSQELVARVLVAQRIGKPTGLDVTGVLRSLPPPRSDDFWLRVLPADLKLLGAVANGRLTQTEQDHLFDAYKAVWEDTGTRREIDSVTSQMRFLATMLDDLKKRPAADLVGALGALQDRLRDATSQ